MKKIIVVAPHADDETLGCGGTLLKHKKQGDEIHWLLVTEMSERAGFAADKVRARKAELQEVVARYGFASVTNLGFEPTKLDTLPLNDLIGGIGRVFQDVKPEILYVPFPGDVHSDHRRVSDALLACTKSFRYPFIRKILAYETLSETEFGLPGVSRAFEPNVFYGIEGHLEQKIAIMKLFVSESGQFPFPRSAEAIEAQAKLRGSTIGCSAAEAFLLLREITL